MMFPALWDLAKSLCLVPLTLQLTHFAQFSCFSEMLTLVHYIVAVGVQYVVQYFFIGASMGC